ncbi:MAG: PhzF family phenazine biosynthesis protein [Pseudomonadota bacterium]
MKPFIWVDAYTETRFGGNPCAVVFDADDLSVDERIAFVRETGLVECAYVVASDRADFGARFYMATEEIPLAGHPTVATVAALEATGRLDLSSGPRTFTMEMGAGVVEIEATPRDGRPTLVTMTHPRPVFGRRWSAEEIAALYGLDAAAVVGTPRTVSSGTPYCVTRLASLDALRAAKLDAEALTRFLAEREADFMEPFLCVTEGATEAGDTFARLLMAPPLPPEDPFTGSATGVMAAYLFAEGAVGRRFVAEQGHDLGRPGRAEVEVIGAPDAVEAVKVGGAGVVVMRGEVDL